MLEVVALNHSQRKQLSSAALVFQMSIAAMLDEDAGKAFTKYISEAQ